jgi:geranylgeranyl diphosphate synthase type II
MEPLIRIERGLQAALHRADDPACPPKLAEALRYAVFPRGARIRPRLCLAVAQACGNDDPRLAEAAATAIELLHCASLVHDDLPCFDDADTRRGKPSTHRAFGEPLAVLTGDALIVLSFEALAGSGTANAKRVAALIGILGGAAGIPFGISAGQAWECESQVDLEHYQRSKTASLFAGATKAGAAAAGHDERLWATLGERLGEAYQVADDLSDALCTSEELGKPAGRDSALGRPSAVIDLGADGARARLRELAQAAVAAIPACPGAAELRSHIMTETTRLLPERLGRSAA